MPTYNLLRKHVAYAAWLLLPLLLARLPGADPPASTIIDPPVDWLRDHLSLQIQHAPGAVLGQPFPLLFRIDLYNNAEELTCRGSPTDAAGHLILTGGWDLVLEEVDHGKTVRRTSLKPASSGAGEPLKIGRIAFAETPWQWDAQGQFTHAGNYRFTLSYGGISTSSGLIHADTRPEPPPWIAITVTPERMQAMLGEPLAVTFRVANLGVDVYRAMLAGDLEVGTRSPRFAFTAQRDDGVRASDPEPMPPGRERVGTAGDMHPGAAIEETVPLNAYLRFPGPGTWHVTAYHAMGFGNPVPPILIAIRGGLEDYARVGDFTLVVTAPDAAKAAAIVARGLATLSSSASKGELGADDLLGHLHEPCFLPALRAAIHDATGAQIPALMAGIAAIATPEATAALIALAARPERLEVRTAALALLPNRLPPPPPPPAAGDLERERQLALRAGMTWTEDLRPALLLAVRDALASGTPELIGPAANVLGAAGGADAGELLVRAAEELAPRLPIEAAHKNALIYLQNAARQLGTTRGLSIPATATSPPGRLLCWVGTLPDQARTLQDEALLLAMVHMPDPMLRYCALQAMRPVQLARAKLPWLELFTEPSRDSFDVRWMAIQASRSAAPATIKAALQQVPTAIWDEPGSHQEFERRMRELSAPLK